MAIIFFGLSSSESSEVLFNQEYFKPYNVSAHYEKKPVIPGSKKEHIRQKIENYLITNHLSGSIAVVKNNKKVFTEGIGYSNIFNRTLNSPSTTYPIGSITKTIVAVCILQLQESGKLTIHDPVSKYVTNLPKKVKIVHLLNHTSGIQPPIWHIGDKEPKDIIKKAGKRASKFPPGTKWDYNDINYLILGHIVEKVSGSTLQEYIEKNIFKKASMVNAGFITSENPAPFTSNGYIKIAERFINSSKLNTYLLFGCGNIYATALDLCLFDEALMSGKLISYQSLKEMVAPGSKSGYGLGLYHTGDRIYSRGVVGGWESLHVYYKDKTSIVVLLNIRDKQNDIKNIANDIYNILNEKL
jgi:CubicO group peptidase (beta-lactamase class C family)